MRTWTSLVACVVLWAGAGRARADACVVIVDGTIPHRQPTPDGQFTSFRIHGALARIELATRASDEARVRVEAPFAIDGSMHFLDQRFTLTRDVVDGRRRWARAEWTVAAPHGSATGVRATLMHRDGRVVSGVRLPCDAIGAPSLAPEPEVSCSPFHPAIECRGPRFRWRRPVELPIGTTLRIPALPAPVRLTAPLTVTVFHEAGSRFAHVATRSITPCWGWSGMVVEVDALGVGRVARSGLEVRGGGLETSASPGRVLAVDRRTVFARAGLRVGDEILRVALPHARRPAFHLSANELRTWLGWGATVAIRRRGRELRVTIPRAPGCPTHPDEHGHQCIPW